MRRSVRWGKGVGVARERGRDVGNDVGY